VIRVIAVRLRYLGELAGFLLDTHFEETISNRMMDLGYIEGDNGLETVLLQSLNKS
jgi:hypothetical protein